MATMPNSMAGDFVKASPSHAAGSDALWRAIVRWLDADGDRAVLILLAIFVAGWTVFQVITFAGIGLHPDLPEVFSWGRHPAPGYYKHPPLGALMTAAWFLVFPVTDWAFYLLAMVNAAAALFATDLIARRYLTGDKRLMVPLLLLLTPFYQFHAERFASNQTLLATWPLAVYCFLRAFHCRTPGWSIAAGASAALAMLGKYYSIYLLGGIAVAALTYPGIGRYLKSASPWLSAITGAVVLAPHLVWLATTGYQPFHYAYAVHGAESLGAVLQGIASYLLGGAAYVALPVLLCLVVLRPGWTDLRAMLWPANPDVRMLVIMLAGFFLLPALSAPFFGVALTSLWTMPGWFLLPIVLLAPETASWPRRAALLTAGALLVFTLVADVAIAPALAWVNFNRVDNDDRQYDRALSTRLTGMWHARFDRPLTIVMGDVFLAEAATFYSADHPDSVPFTRLELAPWVTATRLAGEGWAAVCPAASTDCIRALDAFATTQPRSRVEIEIVPRWLGFAGAPGRFVIDMVAPAKT